MNFRSISVDMVPVCADQHAADGFAIVLCGLAAEIHDHWEPTKDGARAGDGTDIESLHELRIAIRRTRSIISNATHIISEQTLDLFRDEFTWLAGSTGPTRDFDVFIASWHGYVDGLDTQTVVGLVPVLARLRSQRRAVFATLVEDLRSRRAEKLLELWTSELSTLSTDTNNTGSKSSGTKRSGTKRNDTKPIGKHAHRRLGRVVAKRIEAAQDHLVARGRTMSTHSDAAQLHALRKDAKKLRYLIDCFDALLPNKSAKQFVRRLKALQEDLGRHQDAEVHAAQLEVIADEFKREHASKATMTALDQLGKRIDAERLAARADIADSFERYDSKKVRRALNTMLHRLR